MITNATILRIAASTPLDLASLQEALSKDEFQPIGATQEISMGWVPPRGEDGGALVESVDGQWILKLRVESKSVPAAVVKKEVEARAKAIEATTGRLPGKKEKRDIADEVKLEKLPMAFTKERPLLVWIDPVARLLIVGTASNSQSDDVITLLVKSLTDFAVMRLNTNLAPMSAMATWLVDEENVPAGFTVDRECELRAADESKAVVKYGRHPLDTDEVKAHIADGKMPVHLALTFEDRVSFVLTEGLMIKKINLLDGVLKGKPANAADGFDADVAIETGELRQLIPALVAALGGEQVVGDVTPSAEATGA